MTPEFAIWILKQTVYTALIVAMPMLGAGLIVGLMISIFQAVTQINEMTLTFIPKIIVVVLVLLFLMPWIISTITGFTQELFSFISSGIN